MAGAAAAADDDVGSTQFAWDIVWAAQSMEECAHVCHDTKHMRFAAKVELAGRQGLNKCRKFFKINFI